MEVACSGKIFVPAYPGYCITSQNSRAPFFCTNHCEDIKAGTDWVVVMFTYTGDPCTYDVIGSCVTVVKWAVVSGNLIANKRSIINWSFVPGNPFHAMEVPLHYENRTQKLYSLRNIYWVKANTDNTETEHIKYTSKFLKHTTKIWCTKFHYFKHFRGRVCIE